MHFYTFVGGLHTGLGVSAQKCDARESRPGTAVRPDAGPGWRAAGQHQPGKRTHRHDPHTHQRHTISLLHMPSFLKNLHVYPHTCTLTHKVPSVGASVCIIPDVPAMPGIYWVSDPLLPLKPHHHSAQSKSQPENLLTWRFSKLIARLRRCLNMKSTNIWLLDLWFLIVCNSNPTLCANSNHL